MNTFVIHGIEKIIDFVTNTVHPKNTVNLDLSEAGLKTLLNTVSIEKENVQKHLIVSLFDVKKQDEVESLVQNYQSFIIKLLNDLYSYRQDQTENSDLISFFGLLSNMLADILTYIETYFSKYFNIDEEIPQIYHSSESKNFKQQLRELSIQLKGDSADPELIKIIMSYYFPLHEGLNNKTITYRELIYRKELIRELNKLVLNDTIYRSIKDVLVYLNFNHIEFFKYLIDNLQKEYNELGSSEAKLQLLKYRRKLFRQMHGKPGVALFSEFPSIKEQVINWLEEEILFMEGHITTTDQRQEGKDIEPVSDTKIGVALSVAQLGVLIRLLTLGKVITNDNQLDVIKIFASNFKTYKTNDISYGSLYGKYYKPEASAIKEVKRVLLQLIDSTTKM